MNLKPVAIWCLRFGAILVLLVVMPGSAMLDAQTITLGEAVDNTSLTWTTGGDGEWFGQTSVYYYDGDAAQSGNVGGGQQSWIETTVTGPGMLSFHWKVSFGFTWLSFYMDGVKKFDCWTYEWEQRLFAVPAGTHTLRWVWTPSFAGYAGFLDKVEFAPGPVVMVQSPNGGETWYHRNSYGIRWMSTEDVGLGVKLELYKGESSRHTISVSTDNDGYYSWFVPVWLEPGADYRIKITSNSAVYDYSDGYFSISEWYQSSFGGLLVLDGVDDYAQSDDHSEVDVGDEVGESFTLEAWAYIGGSGSMNDSLYISKPQSFSVYARRYTTDRTYGCIGASLTPPSGATTGFEVCEWPPYAVGWHHLSLVFYAEIGQVRIYKDGEAFSALQSFGPTFKNSTEGLKVGGRLPGAVDEVRISAVARYTGSTYTMPTSPFTCDAHTRALWHFDEFEGATIFHDVCGADNFLVGYNGAHTEGVPVYKAYLPLILK